MMLDVSRFKNHIQSRILVSHLLSELSGLFFVQYIINFRREWMYELLVHKKIADGYDKGVALFFRMELAIKAIFDDGLGGPFFKTEKR